jgi:zinc and cadmium transporter
MVLHEFPEGVVIFLLLDRAGFSQRRSVLYAFLATALTTPLGTLISFPFLSRINRHTLGILLAVSAGALVYVGASHLLPAVEKENRRYTVVSLCVGILAAVLIILSKG